MLKRLAKTLLIRDNEYLAVSHFFVFFLLVGSGIALGRGTADALFFKRYGIEYLPVAYVAMGFLLCAVSIVYAAYADRLPAERFFQVIFGILIALLAGSWSIITFVPVDVIYPVYFLVYEVASELFLVHTSLYLAHNLETQQMKRLAPLILAGSQFGLIIGGMLLAVLSPLVGVQHLILLWAVLLAAGLTQLVWWHNRHGSSPFFRAPRRQRGQLQQAAYQVTQGLQFMRSSNLLRYASLAAFFMVITFFVLCYSVNRIYTETFATEDTLGAFFGILTVINSTAALLLQLFVTNRVLQRFGVKAVNLFFPVTSIFSYLLLLGSFTLPSGLVGSFNKDVIMPAFRNPVRNVFFSALPSTMQGRARATTVVVVLPAALLVVGGALWAVQRIEHAAYFLVLGLSAALVYLYFNRRMNQAYVAEVVATLKEKVFLPDEQFYKRLRGSGEDVFQELVKGVRHPDGQISITYAKTLARAFPERAAAVLGKRLQHADPATRDQLVRLLAPLQPPDLNTQLWDAFKGADHHLRATLLRILFENKESNAAVLVEEALADSDPRVQSIGIFGVLNYPIHNLRERALGVWRTLITSDRSQDRAAVLDLTDRLAGLGEETGEFIALYRTAFLELLAQPNERLRLGTLQALARWPEPQFPELATVLPRLYQDPDHRLREACVMCVHLLADDERDQLLQTALEDAHPAVREAAVQRLVSDQTGANGRLIEWLVTENKGSPRGQAAMLSALRGSGVSKGVMERIAVSKASDAQAMLHARGIVAKSMRHSLPAMELMGYVIDERLRQLVDLALLAMASIEDPEHIAVIRAGIQTGDPRHVANACEVLRHLDNRVLGHLLGEIVENLGDTGHTAPDAGLPFHDLDSVLAWCKNRSDQWLRWCAERALVAAPLRS